MRSHKKRALIPASKFSLNLQIETGCGYNLFNINTWNQYYKTDFAVTQLMATF